MCVYMFVTRTRKVLKLCVNWKVWIRIHSSTLTYKYIAPTLNQIILLWFWIQKRDRQTNAQKTHTHTSLYGFCFEQERDFAQLQSLKFLIRKTKSNNREASSHYVYKSIHWISSFSLLFFPVASEMIHLNTKWRILFQISLTRTFFSISLLCLS